MEIHSENKEGTGPTYKAGSGFHPRFCCFAATGDTRGARLRPGNAASPKVGDHPQLPDQAIAALPPPFRAGHHPGDEPGPVRRRLTARPASAGHTEDFGAGCRGRNVDFSVGPRSCQQIHSVISRTLDDGARRRPAVGQDGEPRLGAAVTELTEFCALLTCPSGARLTDRRIASPVDVPLKPTRRSHSPPSAAPEHKRVNGRGRSGDLN